MLSTTVHPSKADALRTALGEGYTVLSDPRENCEKHMHFHRPLMIFERCTVSEVAGVGWGVIRFGGAVVN